VIGLVGCLVLAFALPVSSVPWGAVVLAVGAIVYAVRRVVATQADWPDRPAWRGPPVW
jgi:APA family basic amino acid/polyamine antiporter